MFRNLLLTWWLGSLLGGAVSAQVVGNDVTPVEPGRARLTYIYIGSNGSLGYNAQGQASLRISSDSDNHGLRLTVGLVDDLDIHIQTGEGFVSREDGSRFTSPTFGSGADDSQVRLRWRFLNEECLKMALLSTTTIPTGSITEEDHLGIGQGFVSQTEDVVARMDFDRFQLWTEAFVSFPLNMANQASTTWGSNLVLGYTIGDSVQPTVELNYVSTSPGNIQALATTLGLTVISGDYVVQVAVQKVLQGTNTDAVTRPILFLHRNF